MTTLLLIPGLLCDVTVWQPLLDRIEADEQFNSSVAVADLSTQDNLTQMAQDCLKNHEESLIVAGHSMGARVAMEIARLAPQRIERMALLDTGIHPLKDGELEKRQEIVQFAHDKGMSALADRWLKGMVYEPNFKIPSLVKQLHDMVLRCSSDMHERQINALVNRPDASSYVSAIDCPVLLVVGRHDQWSPVSQHEEMLQMLPNATLEVIEDAGHFAPLEQEDEVAELLLNFFKSQ
jgi:pimeloyl-ACP methyl ester carboxylesterase